MKIIIEDPDNRENDVVAFDSSEEPHAKVVVEVGTCKFTLRNIGADFEIINQVGSVRVIAVEDRILINGQVV